VNFHISDGSCEDDFCDPVVYFFNMGSVEQVDLEEMDGIPFSEPLEIDYDTSMIKNKRRIYSALLEDLEPDSIYTMKIFYKTNGIMSKEYKLKTNPSNGS